jgi:hypothetical protein
MGARRDKYMRGYHTHMVTALSTAVEKQVIVDVIPAPDCDQLQPRVRESTILSSVRFCM